MQQSLRIYEVSSCDIKDSIGAENSQHAAEIFIVRHKDDKLGVVVSVKDTVTGKTVWFDTEELLK